MRLKRRYIFFNTNKGPRLGRQMCIHCQNYSAETQELPALVSIQWNVYTQQCKTARSTRDNMRFDILTTVNVNNVYLYVMPCRLVGIYGHFSQSASICSIGYPKNSCSTSSITLVTLHRVTSCHIPENTGLYNFFKRKVFLNTCTNIQFNSATKLLRLLQNKKQLVATAFEFRYRTLSLETDI
jgi:hypothetical protein